MEKKSQRTMVEEAVAAGLKTPKEIQKWIADRNERGGAPYMVPLATISSVKGRIGGRKPNGQELSRLSALLKSVKEDGTEPAKLIEWLKEIEDIGMDVFINGYEQLVGLGVKF